MPEFQCGTDLQFNSGRICNPSAGSFGRFFWIDAKKSVTGLPSWLLVRMTQ